LISHSLRHTAVCRLVQLTSKHRYSRCIFVAIVSMYWLRYRLFHIHFRLQAAIVNTLLTLTQESVRTSPTVFLDLKNGGYFWKFTDISLVLWYPELHLVCKPQFWFVWVKLIILRHLRYHELMCLSSPTSRWKPHKNSPIRPGDTGGTAFAPQRFTLKKSGRSFRVNLRKKSRSISAWLLSWAHNNRCPVYRLSAAIGRINGTCSMGNAGNL